MNFMKSSRLFAIAATLAVISGVICFLLKLVYWDWLGISIGLEGGLFFIPVVPIVLILSVPYALFVRWLLNRKGITSEVFQFRITLLVGVIVSLFTLAVFFPCEAEPHFIGGYFLKSIGWW
jgi:hypothetical protein